MLKFKEKLNEKFRKVDYSGRLIESIMEGKFGLVQKKKKRKKNWSRKP